MKYIVLNLDKVLVMVMVEISFTNTNDMRMQARVSTNTLFIEQDFGNLSTVVLAYTEATKKISDHLDEY